MVLLRYNIIYLHFKRGKNHNFFLQSYDIKIQQAWFIGGTGGEENSSSSRLFIRLAQVTTWHSIRGCWRNSHPWRTALVWELWGSVFPSFQSYTPIWKYKYLMFSLNSFKKKKKDLWMLGTIFLSFLINFHNINCRILRMYIILLINFNLEKLNIHSSIY